MQTFHQSHFDSRDCSHYLSYSSRCLKLQKFSFHFIPFHVVLLTTVCEILMCQGLLNSCRFLWVWLFEKTSFENPSIFELNSNYYSSYFNCSQKKTSNFTSQTNHAYHKFLITIFHNVSMNVLHETNFKLVTRSELRNRVVVLEKLSFVF